MVHDNLLKRFHQIGSMGKLAMLLDPRTKDFSIFGNKFKKDCEQTLLQECLQIANNMKCIEKENSNNTPNSKKRKLQILLEDSTEQKTHQEDSFKVQIQLELYSYLRMPSISLEEDVLSWWKANQHLFPTLTQLAKKYLCISATSAPSERLFSVGGNIVTDKRCLLSSEHIRSLICLHDNLDLLK